jgi:hypothetical protein
MVKVSVERQRKPLQRNNLQRACFLVILAGFTT